MTQYIQILSLGFVVKIIAVLCSIPLESHDKTYIIRLVLVDYEGHAIRIENPSQELYDELAKYCYNAIRCYAEQTCPWCDAQQQLPT